MAWEKKTYPLIMDGLIDIVSGSLEVVIFHIDWFVVRSILILRQIQNTLVALTRTLEAAFFLLHTCPVIVCYEIPAKALRGTNGGYFRCGYRCGDDEDNKADSNEKRGGGFHAFGLVIYEFCLDAGDVQRCITRIGRGVFMNGDWKFGGAAVIHLYSCCLLLIKILTRCFHG
jgi:hypothetical protein